MRTLLHHPISVPDLVEALLLDRLSPTPTRDGDRPSVRFLTSPERARAEAQAIQEDREPPGIALPGEGDWSGAVMSFERTFVASGVRLVPAPGDAGDGEARARTDLRGVRSNMRTLALADEEIDRHAAAWAGGHPQDDGTGRLTKAALAMLDELFSDPRRLAHDRPPLPRR